MIKLFIFLVGDIHEKTLSAGAPARFLAGSICRKRAMIQKKWPLATFLMVIKNVFLLLGPVKKLLYLFQKERMGRKVRVLPQHLLGRLLGIL